MANVRFKAGLLKDLPQTRESNTLYFVTDTRQLFKGNDLYSDPFRVVSSLPAEPQAGVLYLLNGGAKAYTGSDWVDVSLPVTNDPTSKDTGVVLSAYAVDQAIQEAISNAGSGDVSNCINTIVSTAAGTITVTKGSTDESIDLAGVVYEPTYDDASRTIRLPYNKVVDGVIEKDALVIALGKDMVVSGGSYDKENKKIVLTLNNGESVEIPVADMVSTVEISEIADNALVQKADGLYVKDLSDDFATLEASVTALDSRVEAVETSTTNLTSRVDTIDQSITSINESLNTITGDENVEGSIKSALQEAKTYAKDYADQNVGQIQWEVFEGSSQS